MFPFSKNRSRLFATEQNLLGAFTIGTPFLLCIVGHSRSLGEDFFDVFREVRMGLSYFAAVYRSGWLGILSSL